MKRQEDFENFKDFYNKDRTRTAGESEASDIVQKPPRCANCDIDILWSPNVVQGKTYCCSGCAAGGPCCCDYSQYKSVNISGVIHYGPDEEALNKSSD